MTREISAAGRARMAESGRRNLLAHHLHAKEARSAAILQADAYRANIMRELGPNPSSTRIALAEAAVLTYSSILAVHNELLHRSRKNVLALTERASWLVSNQARLLKTLNLDYVPPPRTLADLVARQQAAKAAEKSPLLTDSAPKRATEEAPRV